MKLADFYQNFYLSLFFFCFKGIFDEIKLVEDDFSVLDWFFSRTLVCSLISCCDFLDLRFEFLFLGLLSFSFSFSFFAEFIYCGDDLIQPDKPDDALFFFGSRCFWQIAFLVCSDFSQFIVELLLEV